MSTTDDDTITLELSRAEAKALYDLAEKSIRRLLMDAEGARELELEHLDKATAADACDTLYTAVYGEYSPGLGEDRTRVTWDLLVPCLSK